MKDYHLLITIEDYLENDGKMEKGRHLFFAGQKVGSFREWKDGGKVLSFAPNSGGTIDEKDWNKYTVRTKALPVIDTNKDTMCLHLFHGRWSPDEELDGWGFDGQSVLCSSIGFTYSTIHIHNSEGERFELDIDDKEGLIKTVFKGKTAYFGDFYFGPLAGIDGRKASDCMPFEDFVKSQS